MHITFDPNKNQRNIVERGLSFEEAANFDFESAWFTQDTRQDYGEVRWRALGMLKGRLHALVFTETTNGIRVISFRKANERERKLYDAQR